MLPWTCLRCAAGFDDGIEPLDRKCSFCEALVVRCGSPPEEGSDEASGEEKLT